MIDISDFESNSSRYLSELNNCFSPDILALIKSLALDLREAWKSKKNVYLIGNGGSAANAIHIANDLYYGIGACGKGSEVPGMMVEALTANSGILTCLANDTSYENIFAHQISSKCESGDLLIALSGSGNSENIVRALEVANDLDVKSYAILGFTGGKCKNLASTSIHFPIFDMQISEDTQLIVGHLCMQWLSNNKPDFLA